jgi:hypothetical protein
MKNLLASLLMMILWSSCASTGSQLKEPSRSNNVWSGTAILLDYNIASTDSAIKDQGCVLILEDTVNLHPFELKLSADEHMALVNLPEGAYIGKVLVCSTYHQWKLEHFLKGPIPVHLGVINYLGKISFDFPAEGDGLKIDMKNQKLVTQNLIEDIAELPQGWKNSLFNPFTSKPITADSLVPGTDGRMNVQTTFFLKPGQQKFSVQDLESALSVCDQKEQRTLPYREGTLTYTAIYEGGKLSSLEKIDHNSFSDTFLKCLDDSIRSYKPAESLKFKVEITL